MEDHLLSFAEWDLVNQVAESAIETRVGKTTWLYKGEKFKKAWYEIAPSVQNRIGFDVIFSDDIESGTYRIDVKPLIQIHKILDQDVTWLTPIISDIVTDFVHKKGHIGKMKLYIDGVEFTNKLKDAVHGVFDKIKSIIKSVKLNGLGLEFKL